MIGPLRHISTSTNSVGFYNEPVHAEWPKASLRDDVSGKRTDVSSRGAHQAHQIDGTYTGNLEAITLKYFSRSPKYAERRDEYE